MATITPGPISCVPFGTPSNLAVPIDDAYNAGLRTGSGIDTEYTLTELPKTLAPQECQGINYPHSLAHGMERRIAATTGIPQTTPVEPNRRPAPKLNPPKAFNRTRSELSSFIMQLNLTFLTDPRRYTTDQAKIAYAASYLSGSAEEWFKPHVN